MKSRKRQTNEIARWTISCRHSLCSRSLIAAEPGDSNWNYMTGLAGFSFFNRYIFAYAIFCLSIGGNVSLCISFAHWGHPFQIASNCLSSRVLSKHKDWNVQKLSFTFSVYDLKFGLPLREDIDWGHLKHSNPTETLFPILLLESVVNFSGRDVFSNEEFDHNALFHAPRYLLFFHHSSNSQTGLNRF